jgi:hypothetical protein
MVKRPGPCGLTAALLSEMCRAEMLALGVGKTEKKQIPCGDDRRF